MNDNPFLPVPGEPKIKGYPSRCARDPLVMVDGNGHPCSSVRDQLVVAHSGSELLMDRLEGCCPALDYGRYRQ